MSSKQPLPKPSAKSWREAPRIERVAAWVFFACVWVLSVVWASQLSAGVLGVGAFGLALALALPMAVTDSERVWRVCRWPAIVFVATGFVLSFVVGM